MRNYIDTAEQIKQRHTLADSIRARGIKDAEVLQAIRNVPRHLFLPADKQNKAYVDKAFPIGYGQTISQPYTVAYQTELLAVKPGHKIMEVGTGSAYQAIVLVEMGAKVYTIERQRNFYEKNLQFSYLRNFPNLHFCFGDGYLGWPSMAPFDRILITAAPPEVPIGLTDQLVIGGLMVAPVGHRGLQRMMRITRQHDGLKQEVFDHFSFVPMLPGKHG